MEDCRMTKYAFFLPTRKGSERVKNKNTRPFAGIEGGITRVKLQQLLAVDRVSDIYISTNDEETMKVADSFKNDRIKVVERPEELCLSSTIMDDFINYIPTIVDAEHIFWVHTTSPFAGPELLNHALDVYEQKILETGEFDSLVSVTKVQQFLWSKAENKCINHDQSKIKWPRTQDLAPLFEINHAIYLNSRENFLKYHDRIGARPLLFELDKIQSFDIDWNDDFEIAEAIFKYKAQKEMLLNVNQGGGNPPL
jgi:N-acylneuraminate cytidylyltransferase